MQQRITFGNRIYPWLIVILPIICQYQVGPLDLDVVVMLAFLVGCLLFGRYIYLTSINRWILMIISYIVLVTAGNLLVGQKYSPSGDIILRMGRYCLYLFIVFFLGNEKVNYESLMRAYRIIAFIATSYLILQAIFFYSTGIILPNKIGGAASEGGNAEVGRLRSFYSEPSVFGYTMVPFVTCSLLGGKYKGNGKGGALDAIFVTVGIVLSTSGQGILAAGVVWACWVILRIARREFKARDFGLLLAICIAGVILYSSGILEFALDRSANTNEGGAIDARMSGYVTLQLLTPMQRVFGAGFGNYVVANVFGLDVFYEFVNYSSVSEFLFTLGILGSGIWLAFLLKIFFKGTLCVKVLLIAMGVLGATGCPLTGMLFPIWLTLMCVQLPRGMFSHKSTYEPEQT